MSISNKKRDIFNTISSYSSFIEQNSKKVNINDSFSSINNRNEVLPFLLDVMKTVAGTDGIKEVIGGLFSDVISSGNTAMKNTLKKQLIISNSGNEIPNNLITSGFNIPLKNIDIKGKYLIDPNTEEGSLIYSNLNIPSFDNLVYDAINNPNTDVVISNMKMIIKYNDITDEINIKLTSDNTMNVGKFLLNYIDSMVIFNNNEILTNTLDMFFGTFSKKNNRSVEKIINDMKTQKLLEKIINNESVVAILPNEQDEINYLSTQLSKGVVSYDLGCGLLDTSLSFSGLTNFINTITTNNDIYSIANSVDEVYNLSTVNSSGVKEFNDLTMRDNFYLRLIKIFTNTLTQFATTQPQIQILFSIYENFIKSNSYIYSDVSKYIENMNIFIRCMINDIMNLIYKYIFDIAVTYLISILRPVIKRVTKEKINQYKNILSSLSGYSRIIELTNN